jgi:predicted SAM-dependent methyltransferase
VKTIARNYISKPGKVLEIGALDVNGSVRQFFRDADAYVGTDMMAGPNVDIVMNNASLLHEFEGYKFDTVIACEVLEHDLDFLHTVFSMKQLLKTGGHLIITTPTFGFPLHRYPRDYWRFGEDAYREKFFADMTVLDLRHLDNAAGKGITLAGLARK